MLDLSHVVKEDPDVLKRHTIINLITGASDRGFRNIRGQ